MFAFHAQMYGHNHARATREHDGCVCVTATIENADGDKLAIAVDDADALEALGWELVQAAAAIKAQQAPEGGQHAA